MSNIFKITQYFCFLGTVTYMLIDLNSLTSVTDDIDKNGSHPLEKEEMLDVKATFAAKNSAFSANFWFLDQKLCAHNGSPSA